jgi:oligopeptide/dipeptide ABC transporter ATP-binding protein
MASLLKLEGLNKTYRGGSFFRPAHTEAVREVDLQIEAGEIVAILGESGSGKSSLGRLIARLESADKGRVLIDGDAPPPTRWGGMQLAYRRQVQMVFQDAYASLNPVHPIGHAIARAIKLHQQLDDNATLVQVIALLDQVGLSPGAAFYEKYPHELSGGQRQRVAIARALAVKPKLIVADEPTSMLDVSIRMDILNLIKQLRDERGLSVVLITHDLPSAWYVSDRLVILHAGEIVESGPTAAIVERPRHPYTQLLLRVAGQRVNGVHRIEQRAPGNQRSRGACTFAARCPHGDESCRSRHPDLVALTPTHSVRCPKLPEFDMEALHGRPRFSS